MKKLVYTLLTILIILSSCTNTDVRFVKAQPESLEKSSFIPNKFQGVFIIDKDTIVVTDYTINGDTINSDSLIVKNWGNYLFVNSLEDGVYKLGCAKLINSWGSENISLEYFVISDDILSDPNEELSSSERERLWLREINQMIIDKENPIIGLDSTNGYFIFDNVSVNQFQALLNNARSKTVNRIK